MMGKTKQLLGIIFVRYGKWTAGLALLLLIAYVFCLPRPLFESPTSIVLEDRRGELLGAGIAADGQWRFPHSEEVPEKFEAAILEFEDRRFYHHLGVDAKSILRALAQNFRNGEIVSGGSTITMQTIRMARGGRRNLWNKIIEAILATRLEWGYSKKEILAHYASNAPFGGNVVGLDAASWRYYGKAPALLSWGEAATLAVLPNSPALIHPGRNRSALLAKRNRLLDRLHVRGGMDSLTCALAKSEPLPGRPLPLPRLAPHLLDLAAYEHFRGRGHTSTRLRSTIDARRQVQVNAVLERHQIRLAANGIHNACAMVMEVETGDIIAYVGNMPNVAPRHSPSVDIIRARRSTGSILKPFLYAAMMDEGSLLPNALISDVPTQMGNYRPLNYHQTYDGAVPASRALVRSLNVPFIRMLQRYGVEKFHSKLRRMGMTTLDKSPSHYGLTLVLGGAEGSLFDICSIYASMARTCNHFYGLDGEYDPLDFHGANYVLGNEQGKTTDRILLDAPPVLGAGAIWQTFRAMREVERPTVDKHWEIFSSDHAIAWKTGTSIGFRDAWAVGVTPEYVVGVWVGNADGEGRPGLVGVHAAAPILFDVFDFLPDAGGWFEKPEDEMAELRVCPKSGCMALPHCEDAEWASLPRHGNRSPACPYHKVVQLDDKGRRATAACAPAYELDTRPWFVLPPVEEHYYKSSHPEYKVLPPWREGCRPAQSSERPMEMIYPKYAARIYVPVDYDGKRSKTVFKAAHRRGDAKVYWHLDNLYIGMTETFHEMELDPSPGSHTITLVDGDGVVLERRFEVEGF